MITYIDTSTLLRLLIEEAGSDRAGTIWDAADELVSAALIVVEGRAALAAARRGSRLTARQHRRAREEFDALVEQLSLVEITEDLILDAAELAELHGRQGYDAVHLAAAISVETTILTSADAALCEAATSRGLHVAGPWTSCPHGAPPAR
ncbi:MAG: type II toxin-antitoxin system VapC family toxin [Actinobacteria bacterium]|nr:type II toxin-antitoxin system VapC family toxin [Actinomycetota bacterium]